MTRLYICRQCREHGREGECILARALPPAEQYCPDGLPARWTGCNSVYLEPSDLTAVAGTLAILAGALCHESVDAAEALRRYGEAD